MIKHFRHLMPIFSATNKHPWSGRGDGPRLPLPEPRYLPSGPKPLSWERTAIGLGLVAAFVLLWPTLILLIAALRAGPEAILAALFISFFGMLLLWWLLVPLMLSQALVLCAFVAVMRGFGWRAFWWQPVVLSTTAFTATKLWIYDYRHLDTAIEFSLTGGIPAGLLFWFAAAGFVRCAKSPGLFEGDHI